MKSSQLPRLVRVVALFVVTGMVAISQLSAQTILTADRVSGVGSINSAGRSGAGFFHGLSDIATFEAIPGYATVQTFPSAMHSFQNPRILDFTGAADVKFQSNISPNTSLVTSGSFLTSIGNGIRLQPGASQSFTLTISFGTWDGESFLENQAVQAAGFTLGGTFANLVDDTVTVSFYAPGDVLLSTQTLTNGDGQTNITMTQNRWAFVGWQNTTGLDENNISYIVLAFATEASPTSIIALDDFGFGNAVELAPIPEPSTVAALAGLLAIGVVVIARRHRR